MIELIKRIFCRHKYSLINEWYGTLSSDFGVETGVTIKTYFCKKCGKKRKVKCP